MDWPLPGFARSWSPATSTWPRTRQDAEVVDHLEPVLEAGAAVRDLAEVVDADVLLPLEEVRAVVGRDHREDVGAHCVPEHVLVRLCAGRRRVDVLRAFEVRLVEERL